MFNLVQCLIEGKGIKQNGVKGIELYWKAVKIGDPYSMNELGLCYERGNGVEPNSSQAAILFKQSAEMGLPQGMLNWADCLYDGVGITKNRTEANVWYDKARENKLNAVVFYHPGDRHLLTYISNVRLYQTKLIYS
jgi:TPR repeat protein